MPTFAAIDIGSNSCRLKIAKVVTHPLRTLKRFQRAVQSHGVDQIRVVATAAMRDARNAAAFQAWVKAETGWNMETISGLEEGRLIHQGIVSGEPGTSGKV